MWRLALLSLRLGLALLPHCDCWPFGSGLARPDAERKDGEGQAQLKREGEEGHAMPEREDGENQARSKRGGWAGQAQRKSKGRTRLDPTLQKKLKHKNIFV